jgi:phytoene dehydrogenase-like protein
MSETRYDAVIIGAGLGGLSAGAFLAKAGKRVLVLEKTGHIGGRCRTIQLMGHNFDIGADYFGSKLLKTFRELGKDKEVKPVNFKVLSEIGGKTMATPPGLHTLGELKGTGMSMGETAGFGYRLFRRLALGSYKKYSNNYELASFIATNKELREILNIGAFFSGNEPENMPAYWFNLIFGGTYGYDRPFYPEGGASRLPEILADVIREHGGGIVYNTSPQRIILEDGRVSGVLVDGRAIVSPVVVSGIGINTTVHSLTGKEHFPQGFLNTLGYYKEGLAMASIFTVLRRGIGIKKGTHVYARFTHDMRGMFRVLKEGRFPDASMAVFSCPDAVIDPGTEHLAGTVKFLLPKGGAERVAIEAEAEKVLMGMDAVVPGFHSGIVEKKIYTHRDYVENFGFASMVSPVAESVNYEKFGPEMPVKGLYCAGSTVLPNGGCAGSSVESGRICAKAVLKNIST